MKRAFAAATLAVALPCMAQTTFDGLARLQVEAWRSRIPALDGTQPRHAVELRGQADVPTGALLRGSAGLRRDAGAARLRVFELAVERPLAGGYATAGKKVMSWDVGYAFRPLDVVQQEDRRALHGDTLEGVPMLSWEAADAERAVTVVWSNPGTGRAGQPRDDGSLAVRLYRQRGARDEYIVLRASARNGVEGGASFAQVLGDALELHGSLLLQQRHDTWDGRRWQPARGGGKALAGFTWTSEHQASMMGEAWIDRTAAAGQQRNLVLRAAQKLGDLEIAVDVLCREAGNVRTASAAWKPGPWLLAASWRHYADLGHGVPASVALVTLERAF